MDEREEGELQDDGVLEGLDAQQGDGGASVPMEEVATGALHSDAQGKATCCFHDSLRPQPYYQDLDYCDSRSRLYHPQAIVTPLPLPHGTAQQHWTSRRPQYAFVRQLHPLRYMRDSCT
jgi:hypothetical protein